MPVPWIILVGLLWVVVVGLIVMVVGLSSRVRDLAAAALASAQADVGSPAKLVTGPRVGSKLTLPPTLSQFASESAGAGEILLFLHGSCGPCRSLWDKLTASDELEQQLDGVHRKLITDEEGEASFASSLISDVVVQRGDEISHQLKVNASPYGIALDSAGFVRWSGIPRTDEDVLAMATALRSTDGLVHSIWSPTASA